MDEPFLLKIALCVSVIGIVILYFISSQIEINDTTIEKITSGKSEEMVSVTGIIKEIKSTGQVTFITLSQEQEVEVVVFSGNTTLFPGDAIKVIGKTKEYKGKKEILADSIKIV